MDKTLDGILYLYRQFATAEGKSQKTIECYTAAAKAFANFLGGCTDVTTVIADDLRRYILCLQNRPRFDTHPTITSKDRPLTPDAVASYVRGIKSLWSWMSRENLIESNPFSHVKPPSGRAARILSKTPRRN